MELWNFGMKMEQTDSLKIMVVDDEDIVRLTLAAMIDHMGHSAKCVNDGLAGKQILKNNKIDPVLTLNLYDTEVFHTTNV